MMLTFSFKVKHKRYNPKNMEDGGSKSEDKKTFDRKSVRKILDVGNVFQSLWIRHRSIPINLFDREFMECKLRFILSCGFIFWAIYIITKLL